MPCGTLFCMVGDHFCSLSEQLRYPFLPLCAIDHSRSFFWSSLLCTCCHTDYSHGQCTCRYTWYLPCARYTYHLQLLAAFPLGMLSASGLHVLGVIHLGIDVIVLLVDSAVHFEDMLMNWSTAAIFCWYVHFKTLSSSTSGKVIACSSCLICFCNGYLICIHCHSAND